MPEEEDPPPPPSEEEGGDEHQKDQDSKFDASSIQYRYIRDGFIGLRKQISGTDEEEKGTSKHTQEDEMDSKMLNSFVTVNFIDPTSTGDSDKQKDRPTIRGKAVDLYDKMAVHFEEEYRSTLRQVPYKHIRSGRNEIIDELPVRPVLTRSHRKSNTNGDALTAWGGAAVAPVTDPAEWHNGPFCHVYIAACENMHAYRTKVRPSLQAFVSQIGSGNTSSSASADGSGPPPGANNSSQFVIVFVPTGQKTQSDSGDSVGGGRMGAALSRLANARQRMANQGRDVASDSVHSTQTDSSDLEGNDPLDVSMNSTASASTSGMLFSKQDKELFRKFNADFPNGTTCIMSTLMESETPEDPRVATLKQQEWSSFMRALGSAIVDGFKDRCRRYDEELRRLQALPGTSAAGRSPLGTRSKGDKSGPKTTGQGLDLSYFFLVKESLAFTYEQMHLPTEALLQYEELRAFLPDIGDATIEERKTSKRRRSSLEGNSATEIAIAGDTQSFRKRLRTITTDMKPIAHVVVQYIFSREVCLLLKMREPVELIKRALDFAETMYSFHLKAASLAKDEKEKIYQKEQAEEWALTFCWDVKCASEGYFALMNPSSKAALYGEYSVVEDPDIKTVLTERSLARELSSLLEFGRLRLLALGDTKLSGPNPITNKFSGTPADMRKPWEPWNPLSFENYGGKEVADDGNYYSSRDDFMKDAFSSESAFVSKYLEMASAVATFGLFAGRQRIASRLLGDLAEIHITRGEDKEAIKTLVTVVDILSKDQWDKCHFWRLLRLASCQRRVSKPNEYLKTLVNCFGPNFSNVAPSKALVTLLNDLEMVVGDKLVTGSTFRSVPFLATRLDIQETSSGESSMAFGPERKQLNKKFCTVGENVKINLTMSSFLPNVIEVDSVNLSLIAFGTYASKVESKNPIEKYDVFKVLTLESIKIENGVNNFSFDWVPINTGQYIISSIEIKWKEASFFYDSLEMRRSLVGIDVLPSDPSQSITLEPYFLVPGNIQPVRIIFYSGSDVITKGTVNLTCSPGLQLIPPGEEEKDENWTSSCTVKLPPCKTGETKILTTSVKVPDPFNTPIPEETQALNAKVATLYRHADYVVDNEEDESNMPCMKTVLEAMVPTLEKPVLTVEGADVFPSAVDGFLISISLNCNSPVPYNVRSWKLELPPPIVILEDGDLNGGLFDIPVVEGEILSFGFLCKREQGAEDKNIDDFAEPSLHVELEDEFGTVFNEALPVDLMTFYSDVKRDLKLSGFGSVAVELKEASLEGVVGEPVNFSYSIDTKGLQGLREKVKPKDSDTIPRFLYAVTYDEADWLVGGNLQGPVELTESDIFSLTFVGVPTRSGTIKRFPKIALKCQIEDDLLPLIVDMRQPETFNSRPFGGQMAVACPQRSGK